MVKVGEVLPNPESGWKRIDDKDKSFSYIGNAYGYSACYSTFRGAGAIIKFNFTGTKIRVICEVGTWGGNYGTASIKIDDAIEKNFTTAYDYSGGQVGVVYEEKELSNKEHSVIITTTSSNYFIFDAVDIDANEKVKPYNPNPKYFKYLIKQNNTYYSPTSSFHELGQPQDNSELEKWYNDEGVDNLNILCTNKELLPQIKETIGSKFQIAKWEEK